MDQISNCVTRDLVFHPGETLQEILNNKKITINELSKATGFSEATISNVLNGKENITPSFSDKLGLALGLSGSFFMRLQEHYDNELASIERN